MKTIPQIRTVRTVMYNMVTAVLHWFSAVVETYRRVI